MLTIRKVSFISSLVIIGLIWLSNYLMRNQDRLTQIAFPLFFIIFAAIILYIILLIKIYVKAKYFDKIRYTEAVEKYNKSIQNDMSGLFFISLLRESLVLFGLIFVIGTTESVLSVSVENFSNLTLSSMYIAFTNILGLISKPRFVKKHIIICFASMFSFIIIVPIFEIILLALGVTNPKGLASGLAMIPIILSFFAIFYTVMEGANDHFLDKISQKKKLVNSTTRIHTSINQNSTPGILMRYIAK